ncbi:hypothetical protein HA402_012414 [Bradysia odoriphaga]|nr:hypothetical protein HA402_012414 [Bradysia odoriphaga]
MEDQASLQLDLIDNGLSHNGNNLAEMEISETFQTQKTVEHSMDVDGSLDITKKVQNSSNGVEQAITAEPVDSHQDDDLIRELEQFEGTKKDDDVTLPKPSTAENGSKLQDTSDLLKDLESDSPCPGPSEAEITPIDAVVASEIMEVDQAKKSDDGQVDSTTQSSNKRKQSVDSFVESVPKRVNIDNSAEKSNAADVSTADTQKPTSEIDSDTELKLLQENSDGEVSMSDVVDAITSTSTVATTTNDVTSDEKLVAKTIPSNEDPVVSSSGNVEVKNVQKSDVVDNVAKSTTSKGDDQVSSNKTNDTTEVMEQDLNETIEADRIKESDANVTTNTSSAKNQVELPALDKASETVVSSQPDSVDSSEPSMQIDTDTKSQSNDAAKKCNGLSNADAESKADSKTAPDSETLPDSGKSEVTPEPIPVERVFDIRVFYDGTELKSLTVERSEQSADVVVASSEPTKHTANGLVELCNFMINHFSAMKQTLNVDDVSTPKGTQRGRGSAKKSTTPSSTTPKAAAKRSSTSKRSLDKAEVDESESKPKQAKNSSNKSADDDEVEEAKGDCCLARWTDRKYYAGRVIEEKPSNKFSILFEDGALKTLSAEVIVFGTGNILPLKDHSVHVLVSDDTYEPGIVTQIDSDGDQVMYTVAAESKTVTCTSSDIYLMEDQAKVIINSIKSTESLKSPETPSSKRTGRLPAKLEETLSARSSRGKKSLSSPEPGFSGDADTKKTGRRSNKRPSPSSLVRKSESSDLSDSVEELSRINSDTALEGINGVQPELQSTPKESRIHKLQLIAERKYSAESLDDLVGPMPKQNDLFAGSIFILTCTIPIPIKQARETETNGQRFGSTPFLKDHLRSQIEMGGGTVYRFFEEIPKTKYRNCKLIAHHPCTTAKYVQCMAANITPVSHDWIIECCRQNQLLKYDEFVLPSGWSLVNEKYVKWRVQRSKESSSRASTKALRNKVILIASQHKDYSTFWQRVCTLSGSKIHVIESLDDINDKTKGIMLADDDFPEEIKAKAEHYRIPVVSTVWVVQSLIMGCAIEPDSNPKLRLPDDDEEY